MGKNNMLAREGELIETKDGIIFDVKGLIHPPSKIIAFPRFIPSTKGNRKRKKVKYDKIYNLQERFNYLKNNAPNLIAYDPVFDETLCEVPIENIKRHYNPIDKLEKLRKSKKIIDLEKKAVDLLTILKKKAKIPWKSLGISGSILVGLYNLKSDLDPIIYGTKNCQKAYKALETILKMDNTDLKSYDHKGFKNLFDFRKKDTHMSFNDFIKVESRKAFQGMFLGTDFFIRFVKNWNQITQKYGDIKYNNFGELKISAIVSDDSEALFTPCTYKIDNVKVINGKKRVPIQEIASFRGRFCQQAKQKEEIIAQGKIEKVQTKNNKSPYFRLLLGSKPSDYMILSQV
jgi:predicted nucleotidyltransferase